MKRLIFSLSLALCAYTVSAQQSFTISGKTPSKEPVVINKIVDGKPQELAKVLPANGTFTYKGSVSAPEIYFLTTTLTDGAAVKGLVVAEKGAITADVSADNKNITIDGTETNKLLQQYNSEKATIEKAQKKLVEKRDAMKADNSLTEELEKSMGDQWMELNKQKETNSLAFAKTNINNVAGQFTLLNALNTLTLDQLKETVAPATAEAKQSPMLKMVAERISGLERVAIGQPFIDLRLPNPDGKEIALSDYAGKGKYVLIDFWAGWCGPCKAEMPNVVKAYAQYKDKGFEIVGVSLDRDKSSWVNAIEKLGITWPQMSDLKFWNSEVVSKYAFNGIPHTVLLDPSGKIIANDLRAEELMEMLHKLLDK